MPAPEDLALARALHLRGRVPEATLRDLLAQTGPGRSLAQLLVERRLVAPDELGGASLAASGRLTTVADPGAAPAAVDLGVSTASGGAAPASGAAWRPGFVVDRYRVLETLGQGAMGVVYRVEDVEGGGQFAMKTLSSDADAALSARFLREGQAQAAVDGHPNVVRVRSSGEAAGRRYLVMDLAAGGDLQQRLRQGPLPPREATAIVAALARGLAHVHARGILHRDLKPANVLFDAAGTPKLVDFGVARLEGAERLTRTGAFVGTPAYAAPEQLGQGQADVRTDVYGLGAVLYHALTGRPPFVTESMVSTIKAALTEAVPTPAALGVALPPAIEAVVLRAMAKDPAARHASAEDLARDLEAALRPEADAAAAGPAAARRSRVLAGAIVALGVAAFGLAVAWRAFAAPPPVPPPTPTPAPTPPPPPPPPPPVVAPGVDCPFWRVERGEALRYRLEWVEHNEFGTVARVAFELALEVTDPGPAVVVLGARFGGEEFELVSAAGAVRRDWLGPAKASAFEVRIDRVAGTVGVTGATDLARACYAALPEEDKFVLNERGQKNYRATCLGFVTARVLQDAFLGPALAATLGAGPARHAERPGPWRGRDVKDARFEADADVPEPVLPPIITDLSPRVHAPLRIDQGSALFLDGRLAEAALTQHVPLARVGRVSVASDQGGIEVFTTLSLKRVAGPRQ